jgi:tRNA (adenine9-N1/guanine9-N1)-methyltransferase
MRCLTVADRANCTSRLLAERERPKYALLRLMGEKGYYRLLPLIHLERSRLQGDPFQEVALHILVWGSGIVEGRRSGSVVYCEEYAGHRFALLHGEGGEAADSLLIRGVEGWREELLSQLNIRPLIAIDLSLLWRHHPSELTSLRKQVTATLGVIRRYLWDRHLVLTSAPRGAYEWLRLLLGRGAVQVSELPADEALRLRGARRIVLLDPSAYRPLTSSDVVEADAFIVGGIVDRIPRPGETGRLSLAQPDSVERRRILFHGDIHGVPNRINMIVEILLKARYAYCGDVDRAIASTMSRRDARLRAMVEIARWSRGRRRKVPVDLYRELSRWLPITFDDFVKAVRKLGLEVEGFSKGQTRHESQR